MEAKEDKEIHENEDGDNSGRVSGGDWGWQLRHILDVATAQSFPLLHGERQRTEDGKEGWRECKSRWREQ